MLAEGNPDTAMEVFNRMFLALDYQRYPVRDEFACRGFLQALLMGARLYSQIEVPNAFGRSYLKTGNVSCTAAVMDINEGHETKKNAAARRRAASGEVRRKSPLRPPLPEGPLY